MMRNVYLDKITVFSCIKRKELLDNGFSQRIYQRYDNHYVVSAIMLDLDVARCSEMRE